MAASSDSIRMRLEKEMKFVFVSISSNLTTTNDREQLFQHLHRVRQDTTLCKDISAMCPAFKSSDINLFLQMFFEDIVGELFTEQIQFVKSDSEKEQSTVSVNDQSILFYIAGFIIKALKKRYYVVSSKNLTIMDKLVSHSDSSSFVNSYSEWFNKQDRGGLQKSQVTTSICW